MDTMEFKVVLQSKTLKFSGRTHSEILNRLMVWIKANKETQNDPAYWMARIKNQASQVLSDELRKKRKVKLAEAWSAGLALLRQASGMTVDQEEHNRRAAICAKCPMRGEISTCLGCGGASKLARLVNGLSKLVTQPVKIDSRMKHHYCNVCGCSLALLTITNSNYLPSESSETNVARPIQCWMRRMGPNFKK